MTVQRLSKEFAPQLTLILCPNNGGISAAVSKDYEILGFETLKFTGSIAELSKSHEWLAWDYGRKFLLTESLDYSLVPENIFQSDWSEAMHSLAFPSTTPKNIHQTALLRYEALCLSSSNNEHVATEFQQVFKALNVLPRAICLLAWADPGNDAAIIMPDAGGFHLAIFEAGEPALLKFCKANDAKSALNELILAVQAAMLAPMATSLHILPAQQSTLMGFTHLVQPHFKTVSALALNPNDTSIDRLLIERFVARILR